jgi:hypothetical protein
LPPSIGQREGFRAPPILAIHTRRGVIVNEMVIPPAAQRDPQAMEIIRVWIAERGLHTSVRIGVYKENRVPEQKAWGIILADTARHVARGFADESEFGEEEILAAIKKSFLEELGDPTSDVEGGFLD